MKFRGFWGGYLFRIHNMAFGSEKAIAVSIQAAVIQGLDWKTALQEHAAQRRVKVAAGGLLNNAESPVIAELLLVHPLAHQCVKHVRQRHDPGFQGNLLLGKSAGITCAVPLFVMIVSHIHSDVLELKIVAIL